MTDEQENYLHNETPIHQDVIDTWRWGTWERWVYRTESGDLVACDFQFHIDEGVQHAEGPFVVVAVSRVCYEMV